MTNYYVTMATNSLTYCDIKGRNERVSAYRRLHFLWRSGIGQEGTENTANLHYGETHAVLKQIITNYKQPDLFVLDWQDYIQPNIIYRSSLFGLMTLHTTSIYYWRYSIGLPKRKFFYLLHLPKVEFRKPVHWVGRCRGQDPRPTTNTTKQAKITVRIIFNCNRKRFIIREPLQNRNKHSQRGASTHVLRNMWTECVTHTKQYILTRL